MGVGLSLRFVSRRQPRGRTGPRLGGQTKSQPQGNRVRTKPRANPRTRPNNNFASGLELVPPADRDRVTRRLRNAADDFAVGRFGEAEYTLAPLARAYPDVADVVELYGLTQYRLGHWEVAAQVLGEAIDLTGGVDQLPTLADCHRALGDTNKVRELWEQLRTSSPDADTMTEGRIVMAGALADDDDLAGAIRLLERGPVRASVVRERHLRIWYALADLYDRAAEHQRARRGFARIVEIDADYMDAADRLRALVSE